MTVHQAIARFPNLKLYHDKKRSGRPRKTSPCADNLIWLIAVWCPTSSKPHLTSVIKAKRLAFAKQYEDWDEARWSKVLFLDESTIQQFAQREANSL